jgi:hypothetical protein
VATSAGYKQGLFFAVVVSVLEGVFVTWAYFNFSRCFPACRNNSAVIKTALFEEVDLCEVKILGRALIIG